MDQPLATLNTIADRAITHLAVHQKLNRAGITIPFPQRVVTMAKEQNP